MDKHITINGQIRHRYNSEGELIHPTDEGIHNFYNWFGESKATDNQGRPRVFYHGTDAKFDTFLPRKGKTSTIFGVEDVERQGHFFTPSLDFAKEYTKSGNVMKVYLKMHKPFDMRNGITSDMYDKMDKHGINPKWLISNHIDDWERFDGEDGKHFKEALHNSGHDSAIIFEPHGKEAREAHIVFHPNQIKSATGNEGNFDMSKESINESVKDQIQQKLNDAGFEIHDYISGTARKIGSDGSRTLQISKVLGKAKVDSNTINSYNTDRQSRGLPHTPTNFNKVELPSHIDVDGVKRPTTNNKGEQIHQTEEGVRNFWKWFGDSNTVDNQGRPVIHYHGTQSQSEIDSFRSPSSAAHWASPSTELASKYGRGNSVYPIYVKSHTPFNTRKFSDGDYADIDRFKANLSKQAPISDKDTISHLSNMVDHGDDLGLTHKSWSSSEGIESYKKLGFDSIHHTEDGAHTVGVFHPNQLKSAIGNSGVYSGTKTNINESVEHPMIDVDGEMKHRHNSEGRPIHHTDEGIRNFHKWFDKSKAVDEHGRPQVFYHGTTKNFKSFDPSKAGQKDHGWYGVGHYFTPDVHTASAYSTYDERHTTGANVMPVYLKIHNPYKWSHDIPAKKTSEESMEATMNMRNAGYDGVFAENKYVNPEHEKFYEAVVFHPHQIKSATGNQGNFDISKDSINESVEFPEEAIVGRLKEMRDSGRYKVTHKEYNSKYDQHEFHVNALPSTNAVFYHHQKGRPDQSWYNPDMAELHTPYPEDQFSRTYPKLKTNIGYTPSINEQRTPGVLYRGMSHEEFKNIKSTGQIKSHGDYNLEGQEGLTYYSRDPDQAAHYAHGFTPAQFKASGKHNVYVVAVRDPNTDVKIAGTGEDEVGIPHAISTDDILHVHVGKAYASHPGSHTMTKDWGGNYSDGSSFQPSTYVGWKKMRFEEL